jgi:hypothetical protein
MTTLASAGPASAQDYWRRFDIARSQMNRADREERFAVAAQRCRETIQNKHAEWVVIWCDLAAQAARQQRNRERRQDYSEAERALLWDAAWLQALEGIQDGGFFFAAPLIERVSIADENSSRRLAAYRLLSNLRTRDYRDIERYLRQLGSIDGVTISPSESMLVGRRRLIETLLSKPRTPELLWAVAAAALTYEVEYVAADLSVEAVMADAREVGQLLDGLSAEAENLTGQDAALLPLLLYAQTRIAWVARDFAGGQRAGQAGYDACVARLWASAGLCLDLGLEGAFAGVLNDLSTANPDLMRLPAEPSVASRDRGSEITEARCRAIVVGDVDDAGRFVNARVVYENPNYVCGAMALRYANARSYRPIEQAMAGRRRQNLIIRFVLTAP